MRITSTGIIKGVSKQINGYCMLASCFNRYFLSLVANKKLALFSARLTHMLNRKYVRTDDAMKDSEETATAITRERSFSLLIHESKSKRTWLEAYRSC